jgi:hypothetical protein
MAAAGVASEAGGGVETGADRLQAASQVHKVRVKRR